MTQEFYERPSTIAEAPLAEEAFRVPPSAGMDRRRNLVPSFKEVTNRDSAAHFHEPLCRRLKRAILRLGLWMTPLVCLVGALAINGLTARLGWPLYLVLLTVGALAGLFAVAARRLLLAPQGKAALGFLGLVLLFASWIAPALDLVVLGTLLIIGLLCSISWLCKLPWEQATLLSKNRETIPHQQKQPF
ncbi:MAG TPA: hypothetical protein VFA10_08840 [Ktedonobacteraceae bacterium]|nr:hypothetical protein [Ktedonobacteraceae bacterium]